MSEAAAYESDTPRSLTEVLDRVAEWQRHNSVEELSEDEAMALAVEETRAAREELRRKGVR